MDPEEYMKQRVENQIEWFSRKSRQNNRVFIRFEFLAIVLAGSIPFAALFMSDSNYWISYLVSAIGILIAMITGIVTLMKYRDNWIEYRATAEMLKRERFLYLTRCGAYADEDCFNTFVQRIEGILANEASSWKNYQLSEKAPDKEAGIPPLA
jgi:hypothetical protein